MSQLICLSVREPWATAIFRLGKDVENRSWRTHFRGQLGIHVSTSAPRQEDLNSLRLRVRDLTLPRGAVVGYVELYDIVSASRSRWAREGQWHWLIRRPVMIEPVRVRGRVGLWRATVVAPRFLQKRIP
jgi:hypothetical protein